MLFIKCVVDVFWLKSLFLKVLDGHETVLSFSLQSGKVLDHVLSLELSLLLFCKSLIDC